MTATKKPRRPALAKLLASLDACDDAVEWAQDQGRWEDAWEACPDGSWMLWIATTLGVDRKLIVAAACDCARLALPHVSTGEDRPRLAIECAERWLRGEATIEEVRTAANAAANAAYAANAADAAYAAANAANAANAAADAAYAAANAANAATYAANAANAANAAYAAARSKVLKECATLVRERIPFATVLAAWQAQTFNGSKTR